jgi:hypothetical protein
MEQTAFKACFEGAGYQVRENVVRAVRESAAPSIDAGMADWFDSMKECFVVVLLNQKARMIG